MIVTIVTSYEKLFDVDTSTYLLSHQGLGKKDKVSTL